MKKQETPAQPQIIPDAVADFFPRPIGTGAQSKADGRGATLFPVFAWNRQNNRRATAAQLIRFHARLNLARLRTTVATNHNRNGDSSLRIFLRSCQSGTNVVNRA